MATVTNLRLRCRAHNQFEAERTFGAAFMEGKREAARRGVAPRTRAEAGKACATARARAAVTVAAAHLQAEASSAHERAMQRDVMQGLRNLGCRADDVRAAAAWSERLPADATLERRMRVALSYFRRGCSP